MRVRPRDKQQEAWHRESKYARVWDALIREHRTTVEIPVLTMLESRRFQEVQRLMLAAHRWARFRGYTVRCRFDTATGMVAIERTG